MKFYIFFIYLWCVSPCVLYAGIDHLLPAPQQVIANGQRYKVASAETRPIIIVEMVADLPEILINKEEGYLLEVTKNCILIRAISGKGVYWAKQTLKQLLVTKGNKAYYEGCKIIDYPAFRVRGFMQDVGRTFMSLEELKREIALLSQYKINVFHWHLTENQGWRLQSLRYPELNAPSSYERMPAQYYTLQEAKELVTFCKKHKVLLIPEIDMPGHSRAFEKAFGVAMQSEKGMAILKELLDEAVENLEVPYIHKKQNKILHLPIYYIDKYFLHSDLSF